MTKKPAYRWHRLRAGKHSMTAWIDDTQCTYKAIRDETGWVLTRYVAGARETVSWNPTPTLRAAKELAAEDLGKGIL
ncbi:hypothetical protein ACIA48_16700 [Mycobacterium sp. NPDC051804]|uniref:hypothetical protein n=1 Tax=Mycobacterium sp. NPDC051804 TaxID=3364295 RepID=UPI0037A57A9C